MTLTFNILMGGALTGAPFNPARALGPMVATGNFSDAWLYLTAPIVGAIVAAILHMGLARLAQEGIASAELGPAPGRPPNESQWSRGRSANNTGGARQVVVTRTRCDRFG
jgi:hypothetical protein